MTTHQADEYLQLLAKGKRDWAHTKLSTKVTLLKDFCSLLLKYGQPLGEKSGAVKGLPPDQAAGEYLSYVVILAQYAQHLIKTLQMLDGESKPPVLPTQTLPTGQVSVRVTPLTFWERMSVVTAGATVDLHLEPGATFSQGAAYNEIRKQDGRVCVVLGAGNHGFLGLKDLICRIFEHNDVVLFKPHPLHHETVAPLSALLQPLLDRGVLRILECDLPTTRHAIYHPLTDHVHMTGGDATHAAIVWGADPDERERRKAANDPLLKVPMTSELGCVTPFLIVPGAWSEKDIRRHSLQIAHAATSHTGCNCLAAKVVVVPADWKQADELIEGIKAAVRDTWMEPAYYPGIQQRYLEWQAHYPDAEQLSGPEHPHTTLKDVGYLPLLFKVFDGLPEDPATEHAFQVEPFAPTLAVLKMHTSGTQEYMEQAVKFCNESLWGDLSCTLVVDPRTEKEHQALIDQAVCALRYGTVCKNVWSPWAFTSGACPWGGFCDPSKTLKEPQSGLGLAFNACLVDNVQKSVVALPFGSYSLMHPPQFRPTPMAAVKAVGGLVCEGVLSILKGVRS